MLTALALSVPVERTDVGKLIPVETVFLYKEGDTFVLELDTGNTGRGRTVEEAVKNLNETAAGIIYLDTSEYLLVEESTEESLSSIGKYLKSSVRVCKAERGLDLAYVSEYLDVQKPERTIKVAKTAGITEKIEQFGGSIKII